MNLSSFFSKSKRRGVTVAGIFGVALSSVLLLCGAGSAPIENLLPQGAMQGDLNAGGHSVTNAATLQATNAFLNALVVTNSFSAPSGFTSQFEPALGNPSTDGYVLSSTAAGVRSWIAAGGGGSISLGANATGAGFTYSGGTLDLSSAVNTANGLAAFDGSGNLTVPGSMLSINAAGPVVISATATGSTSYAGFFFANDVGGTFGLNDASSGYGNVADFDANGLTGLEFTFDGASTHWVSLNETTGAVIVNGLVTDDDGTGSALMIYGGASVHGALFDGGASAGSNGQFLSSTGLATSWVSLLVAAPGSSSATGVAGQFAYDSSYFYVCVATNTWERVALSTW